MDASAFCGHGPGSGDVGRVGMERRSRSSRLGSFWLHLGNGDGISVLSRLVAMPAMRQIGVGRLHDTEPEISELWRPAMRQVRPVICGRWVQGGFDLTQNGVR